MENSENPWKVMSMNLVSDKVLVKSMVVEVTLTKKCKKCHTVVNMHCNFIFIFSPGLSKYCLHCGAGQWNPTSWLEQGRSSQTHHCPFVHDYSKVTIMQFVIKASAIFMSCHVSIFLWLYGICYILEIPRVLQVSFCEDLDYELH